MNATEVRINNQYILYDAECIENPELLGFDADFWAMRDAIMGFAEGRGTTFFIQYADENYVLRHYRRGGLIAKMSPDRYVWTGLQRTRAWREWQLLARMRDMGLPVPEPVAVQVIRHGLLYSADIMTRRIPNTSTLAEILKQNALAQGTWQELGKLLRQFHQRGVWHADLNANNILSDEENRFYLIDFDRGCLRQPSMNWQQSNLQRLNRSLHKLQAQTDSFHFNQEDWQALRRGYSLDPSA